MGGKSFLLISNYTSRFTIFLTYFPNDKRHHATRIISARPKGKWLLWLWKKEITKNLPAFLCLYLSYFLSFPIYSFFSVLPNNNYVFKGSSRRFFQPKIKSSRCITYPIPFCIAKFRSDKKIETRVVSFTKLLYTWAIS